MLVDLINEYLRVSKRKGIKVAERTALGDDDIRFHFSVWEKGKDNPLYLKEHTMQRSPGVTQYHLQSDFEEYVAHELILKGLFHKCKEDGDKI